MEKVINNKVQMYDILKILYRSVPMYLDTCGSKIQIKPLSINNFGVVTSLPIGTEYESKRIIYLTHNGMKLEFRLNAAATKHAQIEILTPYELYISEANREDTSRIKLDDKYSALSLEKIVNINEIQKQLSFDNSKIDDIIQKYRMILRKRFDSCQIILTSKQDARLRLLNKYLKPIFIPDKNENVNPDHDFLPYDEFSKKVQIPKLIHESHISEISIMLKYKGFIPIGYIQVNHKKILDSTTFDLVDSIANRVADEICKTGFFEEAPEVCKIVDISENGLSFLNSQNIFFIKSFAIGESLIFDLNIADAKIPVKGIIRNIKNMESKFRVGVQFTDVTENFSATLKAYLSKFADSEAEEEEVAQAVNY